MNQNSLNIIKEKLKNFKIEYNHADWIKLEKSLPKQSFFISNATKIFVAGSVLFVAIIVLLNNFYSIEDSTIINANKVINNTEKISSIIDNVNNKFKINVSDDNTEDNRTNHIAHKEKYTESKDQLIDEHCEKEIISMEDSSSELLKTKDSNKEIDKKEIIEEIVYDTKEELEYIYPEIIIDNYCEPALVKFKVSNLSDNYTIKWDLDNNNQLIGRYQEVYYNAGTYFPKALIFYNDELKKTIELEKIDINPSPEISVSYINTDNTYYFSIDRISHDTYFYWEIDDNKLSHSNISYEFNNSGKYDVVAKAINEYNCEISETIQVEINIEQRYYLPNAFVPQSGNINSYFGPIGQNLKFESFRMIISDRTGRKVFETNDVNYKWNGKYFNTGDDAPEDVYWWEIFSIDKFGKSKTQKGRVNLIR